MKRNLSSITLATIIALVSLGFSGVAYASEVTGTFSSDGSVTSGALATTGTISGSVGSSASGGNVSGSIGGSVSGGSIGGSSGSLLAVGGSIGSTASASSGGISSTNTNNGLVLGAATAPADETSGDITNGSSSLTGGGAVLADNAGATIVPNTSQLAAAGAAGMSGYLPWLLLLALLILLVIGTYLYDRYGRRQSNT